MTAVGFIQIVDIKPTSIYNKEVILNNMMMDRVFYKVSKISSISRNISAALISLYAMKSYTKEENH